MNRFVAFAIVAMFIPIAAAPAADKPAVHMTATDAAKDPDFALQGEYTGDIDGQKWGVQVIALGDGKFRGVGYKGGLPGDGYDASDKITTEAKSVNGTVTFINKDGDKAVLSAAGMSIVAADGKEAGTLKRIMRESTTLGAKPPEGAVILFDGKTNDFTPGKTDGDLLAQGQNSKTKFKSCTLHVEFMLAYKPLGRGQDRGNSGVYLQGRYEVQVLDSFGLKGENNECGGIYSIKAPDTNMCYPPLQWQTYDIDYTAAVFEGDKKTKNAMITVKHNGVVIHKDVEISKNTTAAPVKEGPEASYLHLQDHGNPVRYRNIWLLNK